MAKLKEIERRQLVTGLKALHAQNLNFLTSVENGLSKKKYTKAAIEKFKKRNAELADYIKQIENGGEYTHTLSEWCNMLGDILVNALDDDNFPIGGDW